MPTQKKIEIVNNLKEEFDSASAYIFADYRGMTVERISELRNALWKLGANFSVAKNTLIEKAINIKNEGPTAVLFAKDNPLAALKTLVEFTKNNPALKVKGGSFEGRVYSGEEIIIITKLPSREVLLGQLAGSLISPIQRLLGALSENQRKLVIVLNSIASKKS